MAHSASSLVERTPIADVPEHLAVNGEQLSRPFLTPLGIRVMGRFLTDVTGDVTAVKDTLPEVVAAGAMARLSRTDAGLPEIIAEEMLDPETVEAILEDEDSPMYQHGLKVADAHKLVDRIVHGDLGCGDGSVLQLASGRIFFRRASNILTKDIERPRIATGFIEQSTRYVYYDRKNSAGKWGYFVPETIKGSLRDKYTEAMDQVFNHYSYIVRTARQFLYDNPPSGLDRTDRAFNMSIRGAACDAARLLLPAATESTVGITASAQALGNMIIGLRAGNTQEAIKAGDDIYREGSKMLPVFLDNTVRPDRGGAITDYMRAIKATMNQLVNPTGKAVEAGISSGNRVSLYETSHPDELNALIPRIMAEFHPTISLADAAQRVAQMSTEEKIGYFWTYIGERGSFTVEDGEAAGNRRYKPGRALEALHYTFDVLCDYGIFRDLQRHRMVDEMTWPAITPYLGYEVPDLIIAAGLDDLFHRTFRLAEQLYRDLTTAGVGLYEAQYAVLLGHKMHWKFTMNAREAFHLIELRTQEGGHPGYRELTQNMFRLIAEEHPLVAEAMSHVNMNPSKLLVRLSSAQREMARRAKLGLSQEDRGEL